MVSILAGLITVALTTLGGDGGTAAPAPTLQYSVQFDPATGSAALACEGSSSGSCTFWIGDASLVQSAADGHGTLAVGAAPAIVRSSAANPGYCASPSEQAPPKWPECTHGPLGGTLDRSTTVDYRGR
jgi:hypothetical protein